jgi:putative sporulation protein YyaC
MSNKTHEIFDKATIKKFSKEIVEHYKESIKEEIVIVNIGTDKNIGDSLGPLTGTLLKQKYIDSVYIYGTLENPIHALNMEEHFKAINQLHPDAFIIAIDACLGAEEDIGEIRVRDYGIRPGRGVGKVLPQIGDISVIGIVDNSEHSEFFYSRSTRLNFIYKMAENVCSILECACNAISFELI